MARWSIFLVVAAAAMLHAMARDVPKETSLNVKLPKEAQDEAAGAKDDKHFVAFAGVGGYGGVGGAVGVVPLDRVLGGGVGGGGGIGGLPGGTVPGVGGIGGGAGSGGADGGLGCSIGGLGGLGLGGLGGGGLVPKLP